MSTQGQAISPGPDAPLPTRTANEVRYYLMVTPCGQCGHGPWEVQGDESAPAGPAAARSARCRACGHERRFEFLVADGPASPDARDAEVINPTDEPSRIVDLGQWLSLFHLLIESASRAESAAVTRHEGYRAALCLAEALKFYGDDELPPASAYREHPEKFARQRLRDLQAKLPALDRMRTRIRRGPKPPRKWWQIWK